MYETVIPVILYCHCTFYIVHVVSIVKFSFCFILICNMDTVVFGAIFLLLSDNVLIIIN